MTAARDDIEFGRSSRGVPFLKGGAGEARIVVLPGVDTLFRPLDAGQRSMRRRARAIARLLPPGVWTIVGYGALDGGAGLDHVAAEAAGAIDEVVGRPNVVVGISFGGFVAQRLAAQHPKLVPRLVLLVSAHRFSEAGRNSIERQMGQLASGDLSGLVRENALLFRRPWLNALTAGAIWMRGRRLTDGFRAPSDLLAAYRVFFSDDLSRNGELLHGIAAPTLVVGGSDDQFFGAGVFRETAAMIAGARLALFDRETHMLPLERADAVAQELRRFCQER
ncbi:MAG TPA: alpha/beta hydrolase [Hyphomicrobium sp.]|nr:alpha/beta hydrolase [Hyphomicrobium sp.]